MALRCRLWEFQRMWWIELKQSKIHNSYCMAKSWGFLVTVWQILGIFSYCTAKSWGFLVTVRQNLGDF